MIDSDQAGISHWMLKETIAEHLVPLLVHYDVKWRGHGVIYVDHEQYNIYTATRILADLSVSLGVPIQQVRIRLVELGWFNDVRRTPRAREKATTIIEKLAFGGIEVADGNEPDANL